MKKDVAVQNKEQVLQIGKFFKDLKSTFWIILASALVATLVFGIGAIATHTPQYRSTVRFTIAPLLNSGDSNGAYDYDYKYNIMLARQMADTFPYIMNSGALYDIISYEINRTVNVTIESKAITDTNIFELTVSSPSADDAFEVLNLLMENYPRIAEYIVGDTKMNVIEGSEPVKAEKPYNNDRIALITGTGFIAGAFLGLGALYVRFAISKTVSTKSDVEIKLNGECLCEVPKVSKRRIKTKSLLRTGHGNSDFSESFRLLKQRVRSRTRSGNRKIIGVTSVLRGEGKTTVAYNLARALSTGSFRILLVDMDLHDRSLQKYINNKKGVEYIGISEVAAGKATLAESINSVSDTFDVLFAGNETTKFKKADYIGIFKTLRNTYDYIVVDFSSCDMAPETASAADLCDELLFVVKSNHLPAARILNAMKYMSFSDVHFMGYVLSQVSPDERSSGKYHYSRYYYGYGRRYGYGYGYGYGGRKSSKYSKSETDTETAETDTKE